ncbi:MAG: type II secretion system protein GspG [Leptospiraceae bacterium]
MKEVFQAQTAKEKLSRALRRVRKQKSRRGLTLVELAIVLMVLGIIIGIVYAGINTDSVDEARLMGVKRNEPMLKLNWEKYERRVNQIPTGTAIDMLSQDDQQNGWRGIDEKLIEDMWGRPYFVCDQNGYRELCTYGADGQPGGEGMNQDFAITDKSSWPPYLKD